MTCAECGRPVVRRSPKARFCSDACRLRQRDRIRYEADLFEQAVDEFWDASTFGGVLDDERQERERLERIVEAA